MAVSTKPKSLNSVELALLDYDSPTPTELVMFGVMDDFATTGLKNVLNAIGRHQSRGKLVGKTYGEREFPTASWTFMVTEISDAAEGAIPDFLLRQNGYSGLVSGDGDGTHDVWSFDIRVTIKAATEHGDSDDHEFFLRGVTVDSLNYNEGRPITFAVAVTFDSADGDVTAVGLGE